MLSNTTFLIFAVLVIIIIIIYLLKDDTIKPARITVQRAGQQGVIIRTYKMPQNTQLHFTKCLYNIDCIKKSVK